MNSMKLKYMAAILTTGLMAQATTPAPLTGTVQVSPAPAVAGLQLSINGYAAQAISRFLSQEKISFRRDPWSGKLVQIGSGARCLLDKNENGQDKKIEDVICYLYINGTKK